MATSSSPSSSPNKHPTATHHHPSSPRFPTTTTQRRIAIAVDLSDESAYAVKWAVQNYLRPGDAVILLHVRPTSVLYGADWGPPTDVNLKSQQDLEDDFDNFTTTKSNDLAQPLLEGNIPYKIHIVKDHDMKERLCLEVERLGLSAVIMGSRGFGGAASKRTGGKRGGGRLGSVSDYCVNHCVCPVVVVRFDDDEEEGRETKKKDGVLDGDDVDGNVSLHPVPEEEDDEEEGDALDKHDANAGILLLVLFECV